MTIKIKEINYGIASRIGSKVYLHKDLVNYPELRKALVQHEFGHSSGYTKKDLFDDFGIKELKGYKKDYYSFIFSHPSSWTEYLPLCRYDGKWIISPSLALIWIGTLALAWFLIYNIR